MDAQVGNRKSEVGGRMWVPLASEAKRSRPVPARPRRTAFTLVELLVVITIIIILMGLLTPVIWIAIVSAKEARIKAEIAMLDSAFKAYKEHHTSYPPSDFSNIGGIGSPPNPLTSQYIALSSHMSKTFPRCNVQNEIDAIIIANVSTPAQAVTLWLSGFCTDPEHPISGLLMKDQSGKWAINPNASREAPLIDFDKPRLRAIPGSLAPVYDPADTPGAPYVYFASQNYITHANATTPFPGNSGQGGEGFLRPYAADPPSSTPAPVNPNSFQIISAGLDKNYGGAGVSDQGTKGSPVVAYFKSGTYYATGDRDNLTNFSDQNLGDAVPK